MIACVDCGYQSKRGNLHWDHCRLMILQWIHIEGKGHGVCEFPPLTNEELSDLEKMEKQMEAIGAKKDADGYFGKCVVKEGRR